jgi:hypothetical protein
VAIHVRNGGFSVVASFARTDSIARRYVLISDLRFPQLGKEWDLVLIYLRAEYCAYAS